MKRAVCLVFLGWFATAFPAMAQQAPKTQPTDKQVKDLQQIERARAALDGLAAANALAASRHYKCLVAFGHEPFCSCLREDLPLSVTLENYVTIATSTKEELGYDSASKEDRSIVDTTLKARDTCTVKSFAR
jgi:hypothetical protein